MLHPLFLQCSYIMESVSIVSDMSDDSLPEVVLKRFKNLKILKIELTLA